MEFLWVLVIINFDVCVSVEVASVVSYPDVVTLSRKIENRCIVISVLHKGATAGKEPMLHKDDWSFLVKNGLVSDSEKF